MQKKPCINVSNELSLFRFILTLMLKWWPVLEPNKHFSTFLLLFIQNQDILFMVTMYYVDVIDLLPLSSFKFLLFCFSVSDISIAVANSVTITLTIYIEIYWATLLISWLKFSSCLLMFLNSNKLYYFKYTLWYIRRTLK